MVLGQLIVVLKEQPWSSHMVAGLILAVIEKLVEQDFACPCDRKYAWSIFFLYLLVPLLITLNISIYLYTYKREKTVSKQTERTTTVSIEVQPTATVSIGTQPTTTVFEAPETDCTEKCKECLTCLIPPGFWLFLFFGDGRYVACLISPVEALNSIEQPPLKWCDKEETQADNQKYAIYISKIAVFSVMSIILIVALIYQCRGRCCCSCCKKRPANNQAKGEQDTAGTLQITINHQTSAHAEEQQYTARTLQMTINHQTSAHVTAEHGTAGTSKESKPRPKTSTHDETETIPLRNVTPTEES